MSVLPRFPVPRAMPGKRRSPAENTWVGVSLFVHPCPVQPFSSPWNPYGGVSDLRVPLMRPPFGHNPWGLGCFQAAMS